MWNLIPWKKTTNSDGAMSAEFDRELSQIREDFDSLVRRMWNKDTLSDRWFDGRWGMQVEENDSHYVAPIEAPGFEVGDFDISNHGSHLVVKAEQKESHDGKDGSLYRHQQFQRVVSLPDGVEADDISASYRNGILELTIPKGKEQRNVKRIAVKAT